MPKLIIALLPSLFALSVAFAQAPPTADPESAIPEAAKRTAPASIVLPALPAKISCEAKAIGDKGQPLAGAARTSYMKDCEADAKGSAGSEPGCEAKAVNKAGKPLAGREKALFIEKCDADAKQ